MGRSGGAAAALVAAHAAPVTALASRAAFSLGAGARTRAVMSGMYESGWPPPSVGVPVHTGLAFPAVFGCRPAASAASRALPELKLNVIY
jgi:hypothetical protein